MFYPETTTCDVRAEIDKTKRYYCFMLGMVVRPDAKGECPECGPFILTHQEYTQDSCGSRATRTPRDRYGYPCSLPIDHEGPCKVPDGAPMSVQDYE